MANSTVCKSKWKTIVEPRRDKPKTYRQATTHWLKFYEEAVIESQTAALPRHQEEEETSTNQTNVRKALRLALSSPSEVIAMLKGLKNTRTKWHNVRYKTKKVIEKSRECHNHKPQPFPDPKRKRKPTNLNKHKPNKRTKSTKISSLFPKRGNRNTKRTEKHKNKMTHGKTYNKSPRRINHKATKSKTNTGTTALEVQ